MVAMTLSMLAAFWRINASFSEMLAVPAERLCMALCKPERLACPALASRDASPAAFLTLSMVPDSS
ncbi:MAG: hypothetical protein BWX45_01252 [Deltaproteobacteria bacterium ADurb.Bin002]|nr:MAG: hypothetical protein BWX45_01252 [Deltaproteobacteria bacterium ADurb.Bin002]